MRAFYGSLDLAVTWGDMGRAEAQVIERRPVAWIGPEGFVRDPQQPLPLVAFDAPCAFRSAAVTALEARTIVVWRHVFASPSLAGLWAAVTAGLGVTPRTNEALPPHPRVLDPEVAGLPALGAIDIALHVSGASRSAAVDRLGALLLEAIEARPSPA